MNRTSMPVYPKKRENIQWKVPSLFNNDEAVLLLDEMCKELGFRQPIQSVYGSVRCSWSGGRTSAWKDIDKSKAVEMISKHNERGISCCFTFSNYYISKDDLDDKVGNLLLDVASQGDVQNYAIVSSDILTDYIKHKYPNIKLIASMLKPVYEIDNYQDTPDYYNNLCDIYEKVVIRPDFNFDDKFLKKLNKKNKIEILANQACMQKCVISRKHYDLFSNIEAGKEPETKAFCNAEMKKLESIYRTTLLSNEDMDRLIRLGFVNFKLRGRSLSPSLLLDSIGLYIFEPTGIYQNMKRLISYKMGFPSSL